MTPAERNQRAFERAVIGILNQGKASLAADTADYRCAYRSEGNCKCAIGHLIPDDKYRKDFEGQTVLTLSSRGLVHPDLDLDFLVQLQEDHDHAASYKPGLFLSEYWARSKGTAKTYDLDLTNVLEFVRRQRPELL